MSRAARAARRSFGNSARCGRRCPARTCVSPRRRRCAHASRRRFRPAARVRRAVAPLAAAGLCVWHGAVGGGRRRRRVHGGAFGPGSADSRRRGVGASALVAGRASDRRAVERPAHREAMVQRQARGRAAGGRSHGAGLHLARRAARLHRRQGGGGDRLSSPRSRHQSVRGGGRERRSHAARGETVQGFNTQRWSEQGLRFIAISDINADELREFHAKFEAALRAGA